MILADQIREHIIKNYIEPARLRGETTVTVRAGDVHKEMGLEHRMPAVCSVLEGAKLLDSAGLTIVQRTGPPQGSNVFLTYAL